MKKYILIGGPTASGKSALALSLAREYDAVIFNADSMQIYSNLQILTARPSSDETCHIAHYLYGYVEGTCSYSVALWLRDVEKHLTALSTKRVIFVGGTGLYFQALLGGLSPMPEIPFAVREKWRIKLLKEGVCVLYNRLKEQDPKIAALLKPTDSYRILRALEVLEATGKSLSFWKNQKTAPLIQEEETEKFLVIPERAILYERINQRFDGMLAKGAVEEVRFLLKKDIAPTYPIMKAIGVQEIGAYLKGQISKEEAIEQAKKRTRNYAKRQLTWFRHQCDSSWKALLTP